MTPLRLLFLNGQTRLIRYDCNSVGRRILGGCFFLHSTFLDNAPTDSILF